ncbi:LOW QUALITY PROTEIN: hypothetical protein U9M48_004909, partial [Paspalum notatum var. saurae]
IQKLHKQKKSTLFIKLDIFKAFDSVNWAFLLEVLTALALRIWCELTWSLKTEPPIIRWRIDSEDQALQGLRQGHALPPMLFILAIDPLQKLIEKAAQAEILKPVLPRPATLQCSLYAYDAGIFVSAGTADLQALHGLLQTFTACSGLRFNVEKTELYAIRENLFLPRKISRNLRRIDVQPLTDKIRLRLPGWKGKLLSKAVRETLLKSTLSSQPIYHLTAFLAQKYLIKQIDRLRRNFLWKGVEP